MLAALRDEALQTICVHPYLSDHDIIAIQLPCDGELRTDSFASTHFQDKRLKKLGLPSDKSTCKIINEQIVSDHEFR